MTFEEGVIPESGHGYRIERTNPEADAKKLAFRLGDAINRESIALENSNYYLAEAEKWDERAEKWRELLDRIRRRDAGEKVETTSRMDPMLTYEAQAVADEIERFVEKAKEFRETSKDYRQEATAARDEMLAAQAGLTSIRNE